MKKIYGENTDKLCSHSRRSSGEEEGNRTDPNIDLGILLLSFLDGLLVCFRCIFVVMQACLLTHWYVDKETGGNVPKRWSALPRKNQGTDHVHQEQDERHPSAELQYLTASGI